MTAQSSPKPLVSAAGEARIPLPSRETMTPEQREVLEEILAGPRGEVVGPLRAALHSPELARRWSHLGAFLRYQTCVPLRAVELAIVVTGRRWSSEVEWWVHAKNALRAGVPEAAVLAIRAGEPPTFDEEQDRVVYEFTRQIQETGRTDLDVYRSVEAWWGAPGVVELTAVIGYYTMVAITLNVHEIPLPAGIEPQFSAHAELRLTSLAPLASHPEKKDRS